MPGQVRYCNFQISTLYLNVIVSKRPLIDFGNYFFIPSQNTSIGKIHWLFSFIKNSIILIIKIMYHIVNADGL